jgi:hypothetical protein
MVGQSSTGNHLSSIDNRQSSISRQISQAPEAGISGKPLEVFVAARVDAVFRTQGESCFKMREGRIRVPAQGMRHRQSVLDVILMGFHFVGLAKVFDRQAELARIQTGDT